MQVFEYRGVVEKAEVREGKTNDFSVVRVSGLNLRFFGENRHVAGGLSEGQEVRVLAVVKEGKEGFPDVSGLALDSCVGKRNE